MGFCSDGPCQCTGQLKSVALPIPEIIATEVLGLGVVPSARALVSSYRPSIVTFSLSLSVSQILLLLCSSVPLFPTPTFVSPKFPHVPLGLGVDDFWAAKSEGVGLIVYAVSFQDFQPVWS